MEVGSWSNENKETKSDNDLVLRLAHFFLAHRLRPYLPSGQCLQKRPLQKVRAMIDTRRTLEGSFPVVTSLGESLTGRSRWSLYRSSWSSGKPTLSNLPLLSWFSSLTRQTKGPRQSSSSCGSHAPW